MKRPVAAAIGTAIALVWTQMAADSDYSHAREQMIEAIRANGPPKVSEQILETMRAVARHEFVPAEQRRHAYADRPLPIGAGQTISQPYVVALMTELAGVDAGSTVLEIGTGSGYQAAVLAELASHVYTIEIVDELARGAAETLERLNYRNVSVRAGDGYAGWPEHAPFDAIVVTAAPEKVPQPLIDQLAVGGRLVIPVGPVRRTQMLQVLTKHDDGSVSSRDVTAVIFVPFTRRDSDQQNRADDP